LNSSFTTEVNENAMASTRDTWGGTRARVKRCVGTRRRDARCQLVLNSLSAWHVAVCRLAWE
jgi:hypothetical protein